jgi:hypothetical protein
MTVAFIKLADSRIYMAEHYTKSTRFHDADNDKVVCRICMDAIRVSGTRVLYINPLGSIFFVPPSGRRNLLLRSVVSNRSPRVTHSGTLPGPHTNICMAGSHTDRRK